MVKKQCTNSTCKGETENTLNSHIRNSVHFQCIHGRGANHPYLQLVAELRRTRINMTAAFKTQQRSTTITLYSHLYEAQEQSPNPVQLSLSLDYSSEREHMPPVLPTIISVKLYSINLSFYRTSSCCPFTGLSFIQ